MSGNFSNVLFNGGGSMDSISQPARRQSAEYRKPVLIVFGAVGTLTQAGTGMTSESGLCMTFMGDYCGANSGMQMA